MKKMKGLMASVLMGAVSMGWAEEGSVASTLFSMEEIVITGSRIPQKKKEVATTVEVVSAKKLEEQQPRDLGQALENSGSLLIMRYGAPGALASTFLRGASSAQVLVLLDGRPLNHRGTGEFDTSQLPMDNVEKIEVLKGAASSMYGANALGGVVNVITRQAPESSRTQVTVEGGAMPNLEQNTTGWLQTYRVHHQQRFAQAWDVNLGTGYQRSEGNRVNSVYTSHDVDANIGYQMNAETEWRVFGGYTKGDRGAPGGVSFASATAVQVDERPYARLQMNTGWGEGRHLKASAYWNNDHLIYRDPGSFFPSDSNSYITTIGSEWQADLPWGSDQIWSAGFQVYRDELSGQLGGSPLVNTPLTTVGTFVQDQIQVNDWMTATANLRYDHNSIYGGALSPQLGLLFDVTSAWRWRVSGGWAFRSPTLNDLYYPGFGNPQLNPERGGSVDIGTEMEWGGGWGGRATGFYSRVTDLIVFSFDPVTSGFLPLNINKAYWVGVELEGHGPLVNGLEWTGAYTYLVARDEVSNLILPHRPTHQVSTGLSYRTGAEQFRLSARYQDLRYDNAANTRTVPGFLVADLHFTHTFGQEWRTWLKVENLGDLSYELILGYPMPRRTVSIGTSFGF